MSGEESVQEFLHFFEVNLDLFDGPIDLLLHLVKKRELPVEKVSLAEVTNQYLHCIEGIKHFDFDIAGEYLVIAATLLSLKASVLLNDPSEEKEEEPQEGPDPHEELVRRLKELEEFRRSAAELATRSVLGVDVFSSALSTTSVVTEIRLKDHSPFLLGKALKKLLSRRGIESSSVVITYDSVSIAERMLSIMGKLQEAKGEVPFEDLIPSAGKNGIIASFIAILELCKRNIVRVRQLEIFDEITIELNAQEGEILPEVLGEALDEEYSAAEL